MLLDPSPCHKLSNLLGPPPPSSVTYFMDGPQQDKHVYNVTGEIPRLKILIHHSESK